MAVVMKHLHPWSVGRGRKDESLQGEAAEVEAGIGLYAHVGTAMNFLVLALVLLDNALQLRKLLLAPVGSRLALPLRAVLLLLLAALDNVGFDLPDPVSELLRVVLVRGRILRLMDRLRELV